jgi:heavy metal translocating P-type ATPase
MRQPQRVVNHRVPCADGQELPELAGAGDPAHELESPLSLAAAARIVVVAVCAVVIWRQPAGHWSPIGVAGVVIGGWPIYKEAAANLAARRMTMELSMSIAIVAAAALAQYFTALVIAWFVLIAEVLEQATLMRSRRTMRALLELLPQSVTVRRAGEMSEVAVGELRVGDLVVIRPGAIVPVDGVVASGYSFVDQARVTGESMPTEKLPGARVYAGSINQSGAIEVRTERIGRDTSYGKIIEAVEEAERSRAPVQQLADRLAGYLVYFALGAAGLTLLFTHDARATISVVIVAGACGVAAGTPLAILGGIARCARLGAIVKGGLYLETLGAVDTVVFDKTGTLTVGRPEIRSLIACEEASEAELLTVAASAEMLSEQPLGKAIVAGALARGCPVQEPEEFGYRPGRGVSAVVRGARILAGNRALLSEHGVVVAKDFGCGNSISSEVFIARDGRLLGAIIIADSLRSEARAAIESLLWTGLRTILLTGDTRSTADAVARDVGIVEVEAELLPEAKLARIGRLLSDGRVVAMVGDGINDAPALSRASVGVAMGSGTDVARESADVVLLGNDLMRFTEMLAIARWTRRIIWQNFAGTIAVDTVGIGLAAFGFLNPLLAAFVHVASEMVFILNSARLLPRAVGARASVSCGVGAR